MAEGRPTGLYAATRARITADLLLCGRGLSAVSLGLLLATLLALVLEPRVRGPAALTSISMAALQGYFALRTRFDAGIFAFWAERWSRGAEPEADMAAFDEIIGARQAGRPLALRAAGAQRLLGRQVGCLLGQTGFLAFQLMAATAAG